MKKRSRKLQEEVLERRAAPAMVIMDQPIEDEPIQGDVGGGTPSEPEVEEPQAPGNSGDKRQDIFNRPE